MIKKHLQCGVPLIMVRGIDNYEIVQTILADCTNGKTRPVIQWDCITGFAACNPEGVNIAQEMNDQPDSANPIECLRICRNVVGENPVVIVLQNFGMLLSEPNLKLQLVQGLQNIRNTFESCGNMLILTASLGYRLDAVLQNDLIVIDLALPNKDEHKKTIESVSASASIDCTEKDKDKASELLCGLGEFSARQSIALATSKKGLDLAEVSRQKNTIIEQTECLTVYKGKERFDSIGGCESVKAYFERLLKGNNPPNAVVFIDEIEKAFGGAGTDTSGVSQNMLGALLSYMQDHHSIGSIFIGPPGCAKSALAKTIGNEHDIPCIQFDLASTKGSLVGESEQKMRTALAVINAISQDKALFIATCNSITSLPPELRRRFTLGTFFFDLPNEQERMKIWNIWREAYSLCDKDKLPKDDNWNGSEIKQCCDIAYRLNCTLQEASQYVVPIAVSAKDSIENLRKSASGRYLDAGTAGLYQCQQTITVQTNRKINVEKE